MVEKLENRFIMDKMEPIKYQLLFQKKENFVANKK